MKTISTQLRDHLAGEALTICTCWKIKRVDGEILGFTEHDATLTIDLSDGDGSLEYKPASSYTKSAVKTSADLSVDNLEMIGLLDDDRVSYEDLRVGRYDFAEISLFIVNWKDLSQGVLKLRKGWIGQVILNDNGYKAELRGLNQALEQRFVETYTPDCRADLGDTRCQMKLDPPTWEASTAYTVRPAKDEGTGSVVKPTVFNGRHFVCSTAGTSGSTEPSWNNTIGGTTNDGTVVWTTRRAFQYTDATVDEIIDNRTFSVTSITDAPDAFFTKGLVIFTSGNNVGLKFEIKEYLSSSKTVTMFLQAPLAIQQGDTLTLQAGCNKSLATCRDTFDNIYNMRGEPYVPLADDLAITPNVNKAT